MVHRRIVTVDIKPFQFRVMDLIAWTTLGAIVAAYPQTMLALAVWAVLLAAPLYGFALFLSRKLTDRKATIERMLSEFMSWTCWHAIYVILFAAVICTVAKQDDFILFF